ncbi:9723_t:CDS:2 [Entrophospora sp. SA101]|nr:9723_t:CDS:2 [Entrophospora sp. SA101]
MNDGNQKKKIDILEEQKTYELSFDDKGMEVNKSEGGSKKNNNNFCCAAGPDDELRPKKAEEKHYVLVNEANKEIRVLVFPEFQLNIAKQETTNGNDSEEQAEETTGNEPRNNEEKETNNGNNKKNNDTSNGNDKQTPPPKPTPNQPTQEEINQNRENLKNTAAGNDKEKLADSIKKNEELKDKGVQQTTEDKTAEEAARKKLAEDKEKYRTTICQATKTKLETNGVKKDELGSEAKTKLEKLENGEISEPNQIDEAEKIIVKDTYEKAAEKNALSQSNASNDKGNDIPWKIIVPVGLVVVVALVGVLYKKNQKNNFEYIVIKDHANYAGQGQDIVCAAISAVTNGAVNFLQLHYKNDCKISYQPAEISIYPQNDNPECQLCLRLMLYQLENIANSYPDYLKIKFYELNEKGNR